LMLLFDACAAGENKYRDTIRPYFMQIHNPKGEN
jgi:hypothetical protein